MATFTDEEYADTARIARGYEQLCGSHVPYALDPEFASLNFMINYRDRILGVTDREYGYRAIDGIEKVHSGTVPRDLKPKDILEKISGGKFGKVAVRNPGDLMDYLQSQAAQSPDNTAILFVSPSSESDLIFGVALKGNDFHLLSRDERLGETVWTPSVCKISSGPNGLELDDQIVSTSLNQLWKRVREAIKPEEVVEMQVLQDSGSMDVGAVADDFGDVAAATLKTTAGAKSCLMMTEDWVQPVFEYRQNLPPSSQQQPPENYEIAENPNCVEVATALGLNCSGGVNGDLVSPKLRMLPTEEGLRDGSIISSLQMLDPLHHQSLQGRVFGNETVERATGVPLGEASISSSGTIVSVFGHTFFARKTDEVDVYDLATGFAGSLSDYESFLNAFGASTQLRRTSQVNPFSQEKTDFHRSIRGAFTDNEVILHADALFQERDTEQMTEGGLFECWNSAVAASPETIGKNFGVPGVEKVEAAKVVSIGVGSVEEMIKGQEKGFVCLRETNTNSDTDRTVLIFKDGDNAFVADGRYSGYCEDLDKALNGNPNIQYSVLSFGGNDLARMTGIHHGALQVSQQAQGQMPIVPESAGR